MNYAPSVRAKLVKRLTGPHAPTQAELASETGVPQATISRWLREAGNLTPVPRKKAPPATSTPEAPPAQKRPQDWTPLERAQAVLHASTLSRAELGQFLREQGIHREQLIEWQHALEDALSTRPTRHSRAARDAKRIRELERDVSRKDRALAETAALLILKKKMALFWGEGDEDDDTGPKNDD
jgi:transposase-like protein